MNAPRRGIIEYSCWKNIFSNVIQMKAGSSDVI